MSEVDTAIEFAKAQLGKPYRLGATGPDSWDCSGLMQSSCKAAGVRISRVTETQVFDGTRVASKAELLPGDLVFPELTHVQMYLGGGQVIQAPHTGAVVDIVPLGHVLTARRVLSGGSEFQPGSDGQGSVTTVGVPNPLDAVDAISKAVAYLSNIDVWKRIGLFFLAAAIVVASIAFIKRRSIGAGVSSATKVAETAALL